MLIIIQADNLPLTFSAPVSYRLLSSFTWDYCIRRSFRADPYISYKTPTRPWYKIQPAYNAGLGLHGG
jgi:hypothetical protein